MGENMAGSDDALEVTRKLLAEAEEKRLRFQKALEDRNATYMLDLVREHARRHRDEYHPLRQNPWRNDV
jgi:hypothetical protein